MAESIMYETEYDIRQRAYLCSLKWVSADGMSECYWQSYYDEDLSMPEFMKRWSPKTEEHVFQYYDGTGT